MLSDICPDCCVFKALHRCWVQIFDDFIPNCFHNVRSKDSNLRNRAFICHDLQEHPKINTKALSQIHHLAPPPVQEIVIKLHSAEKVVNAKRQKKAADSPSYSNQLSRHPSLHKRQTHISCILRLLLAIGIRKLGLASRRLREGLFRAPTADLPLRERVFLLGKCNSLAYSEGFFSSGRIPGCRISDVGLDQVNRYYVASHQYRKGRQIMNDYGVVIKSHQTHSKGPPCSRYYHSHTVPSLHPLQTSQQCLRLPRSFRTQAIPYHSTHRLGP